MRALAFVLKELRVLRRDVQALVLLFVMPAAFILIVSLAARDTFAEHAGFELEFLLGDEAPGPQTAALLAALGADGHFRGRLVEPGEADAEAWRERLRRGEAELFVHVPEGYWESPAGGAVTVMAAPDTRPALLRLFEANVRQALATQRLGALMRDAGVTLDPERVIEAAAVRSEYAYGDGSARATPSAVQQSVPAWLIFSMFFVVVPISSAFIAERLQGTLARLRSMHVPCRLLFLGKLTPYFFINLLQAAVMLMVGRHLVPLFGGDALEWNGSPWALLAVTAAVSVAALGTALLVSVTCRSIEQATAVGALGTIVLAALGGLMVPRFVMPEAMQRLSWVSPLAWGQEGYLDVLLRSGGLASVLPEVGALLAFGAVTVQAAGVVFRRLP